MDILEKAYMFLSTLFLFSLSSLCAVDEQAIREKVITDWADISLIHIQTVQLEIKKGHERVFLPSELSRKFIERGGQIQTDFKKSFGDHFGIFDYLNWINTATMYYAKQLLGTYRDPRSNCVKDIKEATERFKIVCHIHMAGAKFHKNYMTHFDSTVDAYAEAIIRSTELLTIKSDKEAWMSVCLVQELGTKLGMLLAELLAKGRSLGLGEFSEEEQEWSRQYARILKFQEMTQTGEIDEESLNIIYASRVTGNAISTPVNIKQQIKDVSTQDWADVALLHNALTLISVRSQDKSTLPAEYSILLELVKERAQLIRESFEEFFGMETGIDDFIIELFQLYGDYLISYDPMPLNHLLDAYKIKLQSYAPVDHREIHRKLSDFIKILFRTHHRDSFGKEIAISEIQRIGTQLGMLFGEAQAETKG